MACQRRNSHVHKQRHPQHEFPSRKIEQKRAEIPLEESDTLVPVRQV